MTTSFINSLRVPAEQEPRFLLLWRRGADYMSAQPGFIWTSLHKNLGESGYQYFTVACWESADAFQRATATEWWQGFVAEFGFRDSSSGLIASPAVCEVIADSQQVFRKRTG